MTEPLPARHEYADPRPAPAPAQPFPTQPGPQAMGPTRAGPPAPGPTQPAPAAPGIPHRPQTREFAFDGGAGTYIGTALLAFVVTVFTLGICYPFGLVLRERWRAKHSYIQGRQLVFNGNAWGLFGLWWKWLLLSIITIGIYLFWVGPRVQRWKWENTSWAVHRWGP